MRTLPVLAGLVCLACVACAPSADAPSGGASASQESPKTSAGGPAVQLDSATCKAPTPAQKAWLTGDYIKHERFAIVCPVQRPGGSVGLYVLSIDALELDRSLPGDALAPRLPNAVLVLPDGERVGELPYTYPIDLPSTLELTFSDWIDAMPGAVRVFVKDPTVTGDHALPTLRWNAASRYYVQEEAPR
jgi:hypothetical protein